jgi:hypothetical protein
MRGVEELKALEPEPAITDPAGVVDKRSPTFQSYRRSPTSSRV